MAKVQSNMKGIRCAFIGKSFNMRGSMVQEKPIVVLVVEP